MNPLDFSLYRNPQNYNTHIKEVELFKSWLDIHSSNEVKAIMKILCLSPLWISVPKDLIAIIAAKLTNDPRQIKCLTEWVLKGRQSSKSQALINETKQTRLAELSNAPLGFFSKTNRLQQLLYEGYVTEHRHSDPNIQHAYDQRFGLMKIYE